MKRGAIIRVIALAVVGIVAIPFLWESIFGPPSPGVTPDGRLTPYTPTGRLTPYTPTPTVTLTWTPTLSATPTPTATATQTWTPTPSATLTPSPTATLTPAPDYKATAKAEATSTATARANATATQTALLSQTAAAAQTATALCARATQTAWEQELADARARYSAPVLEDGTTSPHKHDGDPLHWQAPLKPDNDAGYYFMVTISGTYSYVFANSDLERTGVSKWPYGVVCHWPQTEKCVNHGDSNVLWFKWKVSIVRIRDQAVVTSLGQKAVISQPLTNAVSESNYGLVHSSAVQEVFCWKKPPE